ncbi:LysR family transcriptional regulator [Thioalkalivibrio denitrificans]|uniref:LysR family transcriptional regulator n=1 Tax=Thioalkalivibrio denitrificans TaxID=108003 RepID=A0A1V3NEU2_9GAMM|nr:selenium metabolism-associated LysR family transcriptional regulator [Thioalkalivibrio denitrificans]OOG23580.1 LysR family transcriptional regulator [Thioalkalivibrio denitrificans]
MADRRLQVFYTVAKLLSFTKAADALHMTQPAVTFQVRQLEDYFNTRLFDRTHNRVSLTEAGRTVYEYAERIFEMYAEMENSVRELTGDVSGALTLGASTTVAEYMLPSLLGDFKRKYPEINIRLKVSNSEGIVSMVENNIIDLGVVEAPVGNRNLLVEVCRVDQLVLIVPPGHPLSDRKVVRMEDILPYPFICREEGSGTREVIVEHMASEGIDKNALGVCLELGSPEAIKGAVEAGMGLSILSRATIDKELELKRLVAIPLDPPLERPFSFVRQRQKFRLRAMEELLDFARNYCHVHSGDDARSEAAS